MLPIAFLSSLHISLHHSYHILDCPSLLCVVREKHGELERVCSRLEKFEDDFDEGLD